MRLAIRAMKSSKWRATSHKCGFKRAIVVPMRHATFSGPYSSHQRSAVRTDSRTESARSACGSGRDRFRRRYPQRTTSWRAPPFRQKTGRRKRWPSVRHRCYPSARVFSWGLDRSEPAPEMLRPKGCPPSQPRIRSPLTTERRNRAPRLDPI